MKFIVHLLAVGGVVLAGAGAYLAQSRIHDLEIRLSGAGEIATRNVVVAAKDMEYGDEIRPESVRVVAVRENLVPSDAITQGNVAITDPARSVLRYIAKNEVVTRRTLGSPGTGAGVTSRLSEGTRAFTVRVNAVTGVSGLLRPGDRVDVIWTGVVPGTGDVTRLIRPGMKVIAIDQNPAPDQDPTRDPETVTLEALPVEVASLAQAQATGTLSLALVGARPGDQAPEVSLDQDALLGTRPDPEPEPPRKCTVRTRRGAEVLETEIPCS